MKSRDVKTDIRKALVESKRRSRARTILKKTRGRAHLGPVAVGWLSGASLKLDATAAANEVLLELAAPSTPKRRGRPKGSKNKPRDGKQEPARAPTWKTLKQHAPPLVPAMGAEPRTATPSQTPIPTFSVHPGSTSSRSIDSHFRALLHTLPKDRVAGLRLAVIEALGEAFGHRVRIAFAEE